MVSNQSFDFAGVYKLHSLSFNSCSPVETHVSLNSWCVVGFCCCLLQVRLWQRKRMMLSWYCRDHLADMVLAVSAGFPRIAVTDSWCGRMQTKRILFLGVFTLVLRVACLCCSVLFPLFLSMSGFYLLPTLVWFLYTRSEPLNLLFLVVATSHYTRKPVINRTHTRTLKPQSSPMI